VNEDLKARAEKLGYELKEVLEQNLLKEPRIAATGLDRARAIGNELHSMGFMVTWESKLAPAKLTITVDVSIWQPKGNLSPDEQKIYDAWFAKANGFQPPH